MLNTKIHRVGAHNTYMYPRGAYMSFKFATRPHVDCSCPVTPLYSSSHTEQYTQFHVFISCMNMSNGKNIVYLKIH